MNTKLIAGQTQKTSNYLEELDVGGVCGQHNPLIVLMN